MNYRCVLPLLFLVLRAAALAAETPMQPPAPTAELRRLAAEADRELQGNILPFWLKHAPDRERGGFHGYVGADLVADDTAPRGALLTCRILWTFSAAHRYRPDPAWLDLAHHAARDLRKHFLDREQGGVIWTVDRDGRVLDARKQVYLQVFAIYGLTEYHRATGDKAALDEAVAIYRLLETRAKDSEHGGYFDVLDRTWRRLPPGDNVLGRAPKSQNSHIHILEAYTNLFRVWPDESLKKSLRDLIQLMVDRILDERTHHLTLFFRDDWTPDGEEISYGHDIELSWLLVEAAEVLGDARLLERARTEAVAIARATAKEGVDRDGGVFAEGKQSGPTDRRKEWWSQAEAVVGFLNAYEITRDPEFLTQAVHTWKFIQEKVVDRKAGDWHQWLDAAGEPPGPSVGRNFSAAKVSIWKCPYHNGRACLETVARARHLLAALEGKPPVESSRQEH